MSQSALAENIGPSHAGVPPLGAEQKQCIRASFARIEPAIGLVAQLYCRRLSDVAPDLGAFLGGAEEHRQLVTALRLAVASLDRMEDVLPAVRVLGVKQRAAGIEAHHYGAAGEALLWTLEKCLKQHFTAEIHDAWAALYTLIAETMYAAAVAR